MLTGFVYPCWKNGEPSRLLWDRIWMVSNFRTKISNEYSIEGCEVRVSWKEELISVFLLCLEQEVGDSIYLDQGSANSFSKGPDGKYLRLCEPHNLCVNFSPPPW